MSLTAVLCPLKLSNSDSLSLSRNIIQRSMPPLFFPGNLSNMKKSIRCFLLMAMILSWVSAEITQLASCNQQEKNQCSSSQAALQPIQGNDENVRMKEDGRTDENGEEEEEEAYYYSRESRVGSRPPSCRHKCEGCNPCNPIQIPTTTDSLPLQYANYEPEGWKCKCGTSFFNP